MANNFKVNDDQDKTSQKDAAIAVDSLGNFVIVWEGSRDIFLQRFSRDGTSVGMNTLVNDDSNDAHQYSPAISAYPKGDFVVVWRDKRQRDSYDIYAQRYSNKGSKIGSNFQVSDDQNGGHYTPAVTTAGDSSFIIVWRDTKDESDRVAAGLYFCKMESSNFIEVIKLALMQ